MKLINALKKLEKAGFTVSSNKRQYDTDHVAKHPNSNYGIYFYSREHHETKEQVLASIRVIRHGDKDDSMADYTAGNWCDTLTEAINWATSVHAAKPIEKISIDYIPKSETHANQLIAKNKPFWTTSLVEANNYAEVLTIDTGINSYIIRDEQEYKTKYWVLSSEQFFITTDSKTICSLNPNQVVTIRPRKVA